MSNIKDSPEWERRKESKPKVQFGNSRSELPSNSFASLPNFKAMVFEGGGSTGIAQQGAIEVFAERGLLSGVKYFAGSSSGSFVAGALACGGNISQLREMLYNTDFKQFLDSTGVVCDAYRLYTKFGWHLGKEIERWYGNVLSKITGNSEITFKQAYEKTGNYLMITTVDLTTGTLIYQNKDTTPDLPIKKAVRRSTALPIIYQPDIQKENIEVYSHGETRHELMDRYYVDGGLLDNYPIYYFDSVVKPEEVVGFNLLTSLELNEKINPFTDPTNPHPPENLKDFGMRFLIMILNKNFKIHIPQKDWERTVRIDTKEYSSIDFNLSNSDKDFLINQGKIGAEKFLSQYETASAVVRGVSHPFEESLRDSSIGGRRFEGSLRDPKPKKINKHLKKSIKVKKIL